MKYCQIPFKLDNMNLTFEVEMLDSFTGDCVATFDFGSCLMQTEFNLYADIEANDKVTYQSWCYKTESVVFRDEYIDPYENGFEYVQDEIEHYLLCNAVWKQLSK